MKGLANIDQAVSDAVTQGLMPGAVLATTLLLMKRSEGQALDLDAPLATHLPGRYPDDKSGLTLRLLLTHTSGLPASVRLCDEFAPDPKDGNEQRAAEEFAATEDCPWRGRVIQGQVHDETAYLMRGVAAHAGLFSTIFDLLRLAQVLIGATSFITTDTVREFTSRQNLVSDSTRAMGWDTADPDSACGHHFSARAFGHTGFTGTSFWVDPETGLFVVLLANRIHPTRNDSGFLRFRPRIHDLIATFLGLA